MKINHGKPAPLALNRYWQSKPPDYQPCSRRREEADPQVPFHVGWGETSPKPNFAHSDPEPAGAPPPAPFRGRETGRPQRLLTPTLSSAEEERQKACGYARDPSARPARSSPSPPSEGGKGRGEVGVPGFGAGAH